MNKLPLGFKSVDTIPDLLHYKSDRNKQYYDIVIHFLNSNVKYAEKTFEGDYQECKRQVNYFRNAIKNYNVENKVKVYQRNTSLYLENLTLGNK